MFLWLAEEQTEELETFYLFGERVPEIGQKELI